MIDSQNEIVIANDVDLILRNLDLTLAAQEKILQMSARNVEIAMGRDSPIFKAFTELHFLVLGVDFDMRVMLRSLLSYPQNRLSGEKYLALTLQEVDDSIGRLCNSLIAAFHKSKKREVPDTGARFFNDDRFFRAVSDLKASLSEMRDDHDFMDTLRLMRNTDAGHIVGDKVGVQNFVIWVITRESVPRTQEGVLKSKVVFYAIRVLEALLAFGRELSIVADQQRA